MTKEEFDKKYRGGATTTPTVMSPAEFNARYSIKTPQNTQNTQAPQNIQTTPQPETFSEKVGGVMTAIPGWVGKNVLQPIAQTAISPAVTLGQITAEEILTPKSIIESNKEVANLSKNNLPPSLDQATMDKILARNQAIREGKNVAPVSWDKSKSAVPTLDRNAAINNQMVIGQNMPMPLVGDTAPAWVSPELAQTGRYTTKDAGKFLKDTADVAMVYAPGAKGMSGIPGRSLPMSKALPAAGKFAELAAASYAGEKISEDKMPTIPGVVGSGTLGFFGYLGGEKVLAPTISYLASGASSLFKKTFLPGAEKAAESISANATKNISGPGVKAAISEGVPVAEDALSGIPATLGRSSLGLDPAAVGELKVRMNGVEAAHKAGQGAEDAVAAGVKATRKIRESLDAATKDDLSVIRANNEGSRLNLANESPEALSKLNTLLNTESKLLKLADEYIFYNKDAGEYQVRPLSFDEAIDFESKLGQMRYSKTGSGEPVAKFINGILKDLDPLVSSAVEKTFGDTQVKNYRANYKNTIELVNNLDNMFKALGKKNADTKAPDYKSAATNLANLFSPGNEKFYAAVKTAEKMTGEDIITPLLTDMFYRLNQGNLMALGGFGIGRQNLAGRSMLSFAKPIGRFLTKFPTGVPEEFLKTYKTAEIPARAEIKYSSDWAKNKLSDIPEPIVKKLPPEPVDMSVHKPKTPIPKNAVNSPVVSSMPTINVHQDMVVAQLMQQFPGLSEKEANKVTAKIFGKKESMTLEAYMTKVQKLDAELNPKPEPEQKKSLPMKPSEILAEKRKAQAATPAKKPTSLSDKGLNMTRPGTY